LRIFEGPTEALLDYVGHAVAGEQDPVCWFATRHLGLDAHLADGFHRDTRQLLSECTTRGLPERAAHATIGEAAGLLLLQAAWLAASVSEPAQRQAGSNWFAQRRRELVDAWLGDTRDNTNSDAEGGLLRLAAGLERELASWAPAAMRLSLDPACELVPATAAANANASLALGGEAPPRPMSQAADEQRVLAWLQQWIRRRTPRAEATGDTSFADVGLDSIDAVELLADLNDAFALDVNPGVLWEFSSLRKLSRYIGGLLAGAQRPSDSELPSARAAGLVERLERELGQ
jgi:acyl carrier protein